MASFDFILQEYNNTLKAQSEGFLALRPKKGTRYSFKALCEAAYAVHTSNISAENCRYREAIKDMVNYVTVAEAKSAATTKVTKNIKIGAAGIVMNLISNFGKMLKNLWKHIKLFVLSFFDVGAKAQRIHQKLEKFVKKVKTSDDDFKAFLRTEFKDEVVDINTNPGRISKTIIKLTNISTEILTAFQTIHKKLSDNFGSKVGRLVRLNFNQFEFQDLDKRLNKLESDLHDKKINTPLVAKGKYNDTTSGKYLWDLLQEVVKSLGYLYMTPPGGKRNLLDIMKETKKFSDEKVVDKLVSDMTDKFKESNKDVESTEVLNELGNTVRRANKVLLEVNSTTKKKIGELLVVGVRLSKVIKSKVNLDKISPTMIKTENELNINLGNVPGKKVVEKASKFFKGKRGDVNE